MKKAELRKIITEIIAKEFTVWLKQNRAEVSRRVKEEIKKNKEVRREKTLS